MIALLFSAVFFAGCKRDGAVEEFNSTTPPTEESSPVANDSSSVSMAGRSSLLVESLFDASSYLTGWTNYQHCCDYSVQQSTEQKRSGSTSLRLEVRSTDRATSGSIRSEIVRPSDPLNEDRWYGFSMYLKDWVNDNAGEHVWQWHPDNSTGSAALALWTSGGRFVVVTNNAGTSSGNTYADIGAVKSNQWVDFVIRTKWSTGNTGVLQVWMNGTQVVNRTNVKTAALTNYFKLGINKFGWGIQSSSTTKRILYFDDVRIGGAAATYADVAPGTTTTTPPPTTPTTNQAPVVSVSSDKAITLPTSSVTLGGSATDADGTIASYLWTKVSGPTAGVIGTPTGTSTTMTGLVAGTYVYNFKATDNKGASASKTVTVTVNGTVSAPPPATNLLTNSGFDNGFAGFTTAQLRRGTVVNSPTNSGNKVFRAAVMAGDPAVSSGYRDELRPSGVTDNGDMWYGYSTRFEKLGLGGGGHVVQWHPGNSTGSATISLYASSGQFQVVRNLGSNSYQSGTLKTIELNKWYNLVWHIKWSTGSDGIIELYIDGQLYYSYRGANMLSVGAYFKLGMNRWSSSGGSPTNDWIIYYDNVKIARNSNYASVAPTQTNN